MQDMHFTVFGGDPRLEYTAQYLRAQGYTVTRKTGEESDPPQTAIVILPVPLSRDGVHVAAPAARQPMPLQTLADLLPQETQVFCGMAGEHANLFYRKGIRLYDYALREEFSIRNAVPTAEGVAAILLQALPSTVRGAHILITGFGRTARACAHLLDGMGADVTVAARRCSALAAADARGFTGLYLSELHRFMHRFDAVVNTVPAPVLTARELDGVQPECPIVEIASAPYGTDFEAAKKRGLHVQVAPSLPGKIAPKTAGIILADTVLNILMEGKT